MVHVPWCASLATVLTLLREQFADVASVVNEYGETIGIVTYDDVLDTVLIPEPERAVRFLAREPVLEVAPGCYHAEGITPLAASLQPIGNRLRTRIGRIGDAGRSPARAAGTYAERWETSAVGRDFGCR